MSSFQYPLARADYNDQNGAYTLEPGEYEFLFEIPANTLSNGDYKIELDVAEKCVRNYAGEQSVLTFHVDIDEHSHANTFSENISSKMSIIRENWLVGYEKQ